MTGKSALTLTIDTFVLGQCSHIAELSHPANGNIFHHMKIHSVDLRAWLLDIKVGIVGEFFHPSVDKQRFPLNNSKSPAHSIELALDYL